MGAALICAEINMKVYEQEKLDGVDKKVEANSTVKIKGVIVNKEEKNEDLCKRTKPSGN